MNVRPELEPLPPRLRKLPLDARGYPVPWFVAWVDGPDGPESVPDFRVVDARKFSPAVKLKLCWICGEPLGRWLAFPIGPMCAITRTISEPPSHLECVEWSVRNCPFLTQSSMVRRDDDLPTDAREAAGHGIKCWICGEPLGRWLAFPIGPMCAITRTISEPPSHLECVEWSVRNCPFLTQSSMVRRDDDLPTDAREAAGHGIKRNPGVTCVWVTRSFEVFNDGRGKPLFTIGDPDRVMWWCEGRTATAAEVDASVTTGLPILMAAAQRDGKFAVEALGKVYERARALFPKVEVTHATQ